MRRWWRDQRGATAALIAVLIVPLFGFAGLGIDIGVWYLVKRQSQSAVDNAALSGAMELAAGKSVAGGPATTDIQNLSLYAAQNNLPASLSPGSMTVLTGCTNPAANEICINNPPVLSDQTCQNTSDYVEAIIGEPGLTVFAGLVGYIEAVTVRARACAGLLRTTPCMIALNTSGQDLLNNGNITSTFKIAATLATPPTPSSQFG